MAGYVDGFVVVIKKGQVGAYKKMAAAAGKVWKKYGALTYIEAVGDDLKPSMGGMKALTFLKLAKPKAGEKVAFSFITYKSRAHRNSVNAKVMSDKSMIEYSKKKIPMPFDMKKIAYGGFKVLVDA